MSTLELRLTLAGPPSEDELDLLVSAGPAVRVGDVARAAIGMLGLSEHCETLWCSRRRLTIGATTPLAESGIRWGDRLVVGRGPEAGETADRLLGAVVTGGPCAGRWIPLPGGEVAAGRGNECEIQLADPSLSRRHLEIRVDGSTVLVRDARSSNGTALNGADVSAESWREVRSDEQVQIGRTCLRFAPEPCDDGAAAAQLGLVAFNRKPRVARPAAAQRIELAVPPEAPRRARLPLAPALVSMVAGVVMFVLLDSVAMLAFSALGPLMLLSSFVSDWRSGRRRYRREAEEFRVLCAHSRDQLARARDRERRERLALAPDGAGVQARAVSRRSDLWERRPDHEDFLALRVGIADLPPQTTVVLPEGGAPALRAEAEAVVAQNGPLHSVPLMLDFRRPRAVGLCGHRERAEGLARWLVLQAAAMHAPADLVVCAAVARDADARWQWLKWLPHAAASSLLPELSSVILSGDVDARLLLESIRRLQVARHEDATPRIGGRDRAFGPHVLLLLDEDLALDRTLVGGVLASAVETGVTALWLGRDERDLPGDCGTILDLDADVAALTATIVATGHVDRGASADGIDAAVAERIARALAPVRDTGADAGDAEIPQRVGLLELLRLPVPEPAELARRWQQHDGRLTATFGATSGRPLTVDLTIQGPHALIVGTTGSGKSELLRTLVASLAVAYPPDRVSFLLVDYKGSSAFAPCAALPHVVDVVSNLDEHLAERALVALGAEMKRREQLLADAQAKDLAELVRLDPTHAPPALVIAVDEFAQLRAEVPDFVDGIVDIARRGRSLGIYMVLAAQSLQDAFTPSIRANTNIRVALRVAEDGDSDNVIAARHAARIPSGDAHRGRGYVRTGHGELHEFQAAYVSGRSTTADEAALTFAEFRLAADLHPPEDPRFEPAADTDTDLTALAVAALGAQQQLGIAVPRPPWLPPMPPSLALDDIAVEASGRIVIGLVDHPERQRQYALELELDRCGHAVLFGGGGAGKSSALRTAAVAASRSASPDALHLYVLESAGRELQVLGSLPHCGAVVTCGDGERVERLLAFLLRTIEQRALLCSRAGVSTFAQLAGERPQRIVLLVDDLDAFATEHDRAGAGNPWELLARVVATGRRAGVHVVMTAERRAALPSAIASHVGQRLVLPMPSVDDLLGLGLSAKRVRDVQLSPGRGFTQAGLEFQIALPGGGSEQLEAIGRLGRELCVRHPDAAVPGIGVLGNAVARSALPAARGHDGVAIGIGGHELAPAIVDLSDLHFLVVGPYRSGRTTVLQTLALGLAGATTVPPLYLLAPRPTRLAELGVWTGVGRGTTGCAELTAQLHDELQARAAGDTQDPPLLIVVDDGGDISDSATQALLERIVRVGRDTNVRVVAAAESGSARAIGVPWLRELRKEGHGLLLRPDLPGDGDLLGAALPRRTGAAFPEGRGFLVRAGRHSLVQVAR